MTGNAILDRDFSSDRRSRQGTINKRRARGPARLILVFRPPKNSDLTPLIRGLKHYYLNYRSKEY